MTLVLGYDVETTGLDCNNDKIIEVGMVLWNVEEKKMVDMKSIFINQPNLVIPDFIKELTSITEKDLETGPSWSEAQKQMLHFSEQADFWVAHNADFDRNMTLGQADLDPGLEIEIREKPWIDTQIDLPMTKLKAKGSLVTIAANHGFLNPFAHRAVFDVLTMMKIFSMYEWGKILARQQSTTLDIKADVSFKEKDKAKEAGFKWDPTRKIWHIKIKECDLEATNWDFKVSSLGQRQ